MAPQSLISPVATYTFTELHITQSPISWRIEVGRQSPTQSHANAPSFFRRSAIKPGLAAR